MKQIMNAACPHCNDTTSVRLDYYPAPVWQPCPHCQNDRTKRSK